MWALCGQLSCLDGLRCIAFLFIYKRGIAEGVLFVIVGV